MDMDILYHISNSDLSEIESVIPEDASSTNKVGVVQRMVIKGTTDSSGNYVITGIDTLQSNSVPIFYAQDVATIAATDAMTTVGFSKPLNKWLIHMTSFSTGQAIASGNVSGFLYYINYH